MSIRSRTRNRFTITQNTVLAVKAMSYDFADTDVKPFWTLKYVQLGRNVRKRPKPLALISHMRALHAKNTKARQIAAIRNR